MITLFHHPFCPHSRFVRVVLGEYGLDTRLAEERVWERREEFLVMNPAATTPVLVAEGAPAVPGAATIAEYLDEAYGSRMGERRLMPATLNERVEVRRLASWFNDKFFEEVSGPLVMERIYKRYMPRGGRAAARRWPMRCARRGPICAIIWPISAGWRKTRNWLAGDRLSYADLAAAAHLSAIDYLGDVPWSEDDAAKTWYARVKSRPSFRPLLDETLAGVPASPTYADLDF